MSFKELTPWFKEVFNLVDDSCKKLNAPLYLIGAQARHFHLSEQGIKPGRDTGGIDFAIMLPDMKIYEELLQSLLKNGFRKVTEPYRIIHDVLIHYFDLNDNRFYEIWPDCMDEFSETGFTLEAGAWLAGYDIGKLLEEHDSLKIYIMNILTNEVNQEAGKISRYYYNFGLKSYDF
jgi:hypothetical protein